MTRIVSCIFTFAYCLMILACNPRNKASVNRSYSVQVESGVRGKLTELTGNQMPLKTIEKGKGKPLQTQVYIFNQLSVSQLVGLNEQWCKQVNTAPIRSQWSDSVGNYYINLNPGKYTILVAYNDGYFIPFFNQYNEIATISVVKSKIVQLDIKVNTKAVY